MSTWHAAVLFIAGIGGGLAGSIAGLASLSTYPALLGLGLLPVAANVTNTAALIFNGIGSAWGSAPELRGQASTLKRLIPMALIGGAGGAGLLLAIPAQGFEYIVPVILATAAVIILLPRRTPSLGARQGPLRSLAILAICVQGGFFGAAAGVLMLAVLMSMGKTSLSHANAIKNVVLGIANCSATVVFIVFAPINWFAVIVLGLGCLVGSRLGPPIVRRVPENPLRVLVALAGLALAVKLGLDTYR